MAMDESEKKEQAARMLTYFWQEKGDLERWCDFDREYLAREFPEVLKAWDAHSIAYREMCLAIKRIN